jgi:hypothetical protein
MAAHSYDGESVTNSVRWRFIAYARGLKAGLASNAAARADAHTGSGVVMSVYPFAGHAVRGYGKPSFNPTVSG